jgi:hypothetical protein
MKTKFLGAAVAAAFFPTPVLATTTLDQSYLPRARSR